MIIARKKLLAICGRDAVKVAADSSGGKQALASNQGCAEMTDQAIYLIPPCGM